MNWTSPGIGTVLRRWRPSIRHISAIGPTVRLELERSDNGGPIEAELTRERFQELDLKTGEEVHVKPRKLQVFTEDYSI